MALSEVEMVFVWLKLAEDDWDTILLPIGLVGSMLGLELGLR